MLKEIDSECSLLTKDMISGFDSKVIGSKVLPSITLASTGNSFSTNLTELDRAKSISIKQEEAPLSISANDGILFKVMGITKLASGRVVARQTSEMKTELRK